MKRICFDHDKIQGYLMDISWLLVSVNDGINRELASLHYASVDTAVKQVIKLGQGALMAKVDIRHAYRNVPVHPDDRPLLGMQWRG